MIIDIQPTFRKAEGIDLIALDHMGHGNMYVIECANGQPFTVKWDAEGFAEFQPKRTVTEMMAIWEQGIKDQIEVAKKVIATKNHPTWTQPVYDAKDNVIGYKPYKLQSTYNYERKLDTLNSQLGSMRFVQLLSTDEWEKRLEKVCIV